MKKCPYCAEEIQDEAVVCRYCGRDLQGPLPGVVPVMATSIRKPKRTNWVAILLVVLLGVCGTFWLLAQLGDTISSPSRLPPTRKYSIQYRVTGTAKTASLTYQNEDGNTEQMTVNIPWSKYVDMSPGEFAYISAQNQGETGSVSCEIRVDGIKIETATSTGAFVIATCSGSAEN